MGIFQDIPIATWAFLEAYGWLTVITVILAYIIYKKYIYDLLKAREEQKRLEERKKYDTEIREKDAVKMREARLKQQNEHDEKMAIEAEKRKEKEREEAERRRIEEEEEEKTFGSVGHSTPPPSPVQLLFKNPRHQAIELIDNLSGSASIVIFGDSDCMEFRKACQLVATYRLDNSKFQIFELDKQKKWPIEEIKKVIKLRFGQEESPFVFVCGQFIGGLQEARDYDKEFGLDKAYLRLLH